MATNDDVPAAADDDDYPATDAVGSPSIGSTPEHLEHLPVQVPAGMTPDLWARVLVADRSTRGWVRFHAGELLINHARGLLVLLGGLVAGGGGGWAVLQAQLGG